MAKHMRPTAGDAGSNHDVTIDRRSLLAKGAIAGAATLLPAAGIFASATPAAASIGRLRQHGDASGDVAILRFLAAAEILETDLWVQYNELAMGNPDFKSALLNIDSDMAAYVAENTEDEFSHFNFINHFLESEHRMAVSLDQFKKNFSSGATGAKQIPRLTNLAHLNVDTSWYTRYRSNSNPDLGDNPPQIIDIVDRPGIPLHNGYTTNEMQAIANTAAFHFGMIEQGGSSLYNTMSQKASHLEVLRIVTNIGGTEVAHFAIWNDKAGSVPAVDSGDGLVFPNFANNPTFVFNQVMPKPCKFLSNDLPVCSIIRPTSVANSGPKAVVKFLTQTGLFHGQSDDFFEALNDLAEDAEEATRRI